MNLNDRVSRLEEKNSKALEEMSHDEFFRSIGIDPEKYEQLSSDDRLRILFPALGVPGDFENMTTNELDDILLRLYRETEPESSEKKSSVYHHNQVKGKP